jgi:hypothetical protein
MKNCINSWTKSTLEKTEWATKNWHSRETGNTRQILTKPKHNTENKKNEQVFSKSK